MKEFPKGRIAKSVWQVLDAFELKTGTKEVDLINKKEKQEQILRVRFCLTIIGNVSNLTESRIKQLSQKLISITNDHSLKIYRTEKGSIKIYIEAEKETFLKLVELLKNNKLSMLIAEEVKDLQLEFLNRKKYEYDIALSFAGEDREYVKQVADYLKRKELKVFFDEYEQMKMCGKDLYQYLNDVYKNKCRFTLVFISVSYAKKRWTKHEFKSAQTRAFEENHEYLLPVRLDSTSLPGFNETIAYIDGNDLK